MDHIINVATVGRRMKQKPKGQRLHHLFIGVPEQLTKQEKDEVVEIIKRETKKTLDFITSIPVRRKESA